MLDLTADNTGFIRKVQTQKNGMKANTYYLIFVNS